METALFNEKTLGEEIKKKWGEYGVHYEIYQMMMKQLNTNFQEYNRGYADGLKAGKIPF